MPHPKGWGLIDGKLIAIDGTKIRAQNSKHNCITQSGLEKKIAYADEQINAYLMSIYDLGVYTTSLILRLLGEELAVTQEFSLANARMVDRILKEIGY